MMSPNRTRTAIFSLVLSGLVLAACGSSSSSGSTTTSTQAGATQKTLTIMVTNDDGVTAPGISALVQGLKSLPNTQITVVAPLTNQSGTGGKTTAGTLVDVTGEDRRRLSGHRGQRLSG